MVVLNSRHNEQPHGISPVTYDCAAFSFYRSYYEENYRVFYACFVRFPFFCSLKKHFDDDGIPIDVSATITQIADVKAVSGILYSASTAKIKSSKSTELILQDFKKHYFIDRETEITLPYFVYLPKDYKKNGNYPLVFFVPDASADTSIENATLTQGKGAIVWASPEEQTKHSAIVVAVQYPYSVVKEFGPLTDDSNTWTKGLTAVDNLLHNLIQNYAIDESRIYGTGQSQGCMTNIALSDKHPDLFAAQFLVAGQWNVE